MKNFIKVIILLIGITSYSQTTVKGVVTDEKNNPLPQVNVVVGSNVSTTTDSDGKFSVATNLKGVQKIKVTYLGYLSQTKNLNVDYRTSTNQPSITQLQPVLDQSNINRQTIGNPDLKRSYQHNMNIRFFSSKVISQKNFFALVNASTTNNSIINYDSILPSRVILSKPVNVNGAYRVFGSLNYGFGMKKIYSRFNFGLNTGLNNNISYTNGLLNTIVTKSFGPSFRYSFQIDEKIDIDLSARYSYSQTNNKINSGLNTNFLTKVFGAEMNNYLPFDFLINQEYQ